MPDQKPSPIDLLTYRARPGRATRMVSWRAFQKEVDTLARAILESDVNPTHFIGIFQGGWLVAQSLADHFTGAVVLGAAVPRPNASEPLRALFAAQDGILTGTCPDSLGTVVLVDEVVDSGLTAGLFMKWLREDLGMRPYLACLAADTSASPAPDFAAQRLENLPEMIFPWRVVRDFEHTAAWLLSSGPLSIDEMNERLHDVGHDIAPETVEAHIRALAARGVVRPAAGGRWARRGTGGDPGLL